MATRAELMAELDMLRAKMAELEAEDADTAKAEDPPSDDPPDEPATDEETGLAAAQSELERILAPHGVSVEDIESLADQLWTELGSLPQNKPLVTAIGAFALGFVLGRATK